MLLMESQHQESGEIKRFLGWEFLDAGVQYLYLAIPFLPWYLPPLS